MGRLTFGINVTLDGCVDHTVGIVDEELHDFWTRVMDQSGAMLFGRHTYELMEGAWPVVARDETSPPRGASRGRPLTTQRRMRGRRPRQMLDPIDVRPREQP